MSKKITLKACYTKKTDSSYIMLNVDSIYKCYIKATYIYETHMIFITRTKKFPMLNKCLSNLIDLRLNEYK